MVLLLLCCKSLSHAQKIPLDSIKDLFEGHASIDTTLVNIRNDLVHQKIFYEPEDSTLLSFTRETLKIAEDLNYVKGQVMAIQRIAVVIQYLQGKPIESIDYYQKALGLLADKPKLKKYIPGSLINLANIYNEQGDHEKALQLFKRLYRDFKNNDITSQRIATVFADMGNYDSAIYYFKIAIVDATKIKNYHALAYSHGSIAFQLAMINQLDSAKMHVEKSLSLLEQHKIEFIKRTIYGNAATIYQKTGDYDRAEKYANEALEVGSPGSLASLRNINATLYEVYKARKEFNKALEAYEKYVAFNDSVTNNDRRLETAKKEIEFEARQKELLAKAEIDQQNLEKNIFISSGGALMFFLLVGFVLYRQKSQERTRAIEADYRRNLAESKLTALRAQLNPHFIFNALNAIDSYMNEAGVEKASAYLAKFSTLMRSILDNSDKSWISLEEDLALIKLYLDIELLRMDDKLGYGIYVDDNIDPSNVMVPSLFLQPFIENSIEHGISQKPGGGRVSIRIEKEEKELICIVEDDGSGFSGDIHEGSKGLYIGSSRIDYIDQITNGESQFEITNRDPGVRVTVRIPYKTEF